jgi:hypothetical protein
MQLQGPQGQQVAVHTCRGLQRGALAPVDISNAKHAHHCETLRLGLLREPGRLVLAVQHALVVWEGVGDALRRLNQTPAART